MSKGVYEYLQYIGAQAILDADLTTFCKGKLKVFVGEEDKNIPSADLCPMAVLVAGGRGTDGNDHLKTRSAKITLAIADTTVPNTTGVITYAGLGKLDEYADLWEKFLVNMTPHSSGYYSHSISGGSEDQVETPVFKAFLSLSIILDSDY